MVVLAVAVALVVVVETDPINVTIANKKATCPKIAQTRKVVVSSYCFLLLSKTY